MSDANTPVPGVSGAVKVLLVDDIEEMRNILRQLLGFMGYRDVVTARNGEEAWRLLQSKDFDLVLCDWNMPKLSGRELLERVRAEAGLLHLPFIMITGESDVTKVKQAVAGGVTDFILKPFTAARLQQRIEQALKAARR